MKRGDNRGKALTLAVMREANVGRRRFSINRCDVVKTTVYFRPMQRDVDPGQQAKQDAWLRALSDAERARMVGVMWRSGRRVAEINVRNRYPGASDVKVRWHVIELLYGAYVARRYLGRCPP